VAEGDGLNDGIVDVVDGVSNAVIQRIAIPSGVLDVTVNSTTGKVYAAGIGVTVIDESTNTVTAVIPVVVVTANSTCAIAASSTTNKVYASTGDGVVVIDGVTNTFGAPVPVAAACIVVDEVANRVYVGGQYLTVLR
jgi:hypothetical protein